MMLMKTELIMQVHQGHWDRKESNILIMSHQAYFCAHISNGRVGVFDFGQEDDNDDYCKALDLDLGMGEHNGTPHPMPMLVQAHNQNKMGSVQ